MFFTWLGNCWEGHEEWLKRPWAPRCWDIFLKCILTALHNQDIPHSFTIIPRTIFTLSTLHNNFYNTSHLWIIPIPTIHSFLMVFYSKLSSCGKNIRKSKTCVGVKVFNLLILLSDYSGKPANSFAIKSWDISLSWEHSLGSLADLWNPTKTHRGIYLKNFYRQFEVEYCWIFCIFPHVQNFSFWGYGLICWLPQNVTS